MRVGVFLCTADTSLLAALFAPFGARWTPGQMKDTMRHVQNVKYLIEPKRLAGAGGEIVTCFNWCIGVVSGLISIVPFFSDFSRFYSRF